MLICRFHFRRSVPLNNSVTSYLDDLILRIDILTPSKVEAFGALYLLNPLLN
jgi:hypothetical protein